MLEERKLAGYCGMYCSACAIHTGEMKKSHRTIKRTCGYMSSLESSSFSEDSKSYHNS